MSNTPEMRSHLERATSSLQAANLLRSAELPNDAASRAYYAVFPSYPLLNPTSPPRQTLKLMPRS